MPDTRTGAHAAPNAHGLPVQTDGVSFRGIVWFLVVIFATTMFCQGLIIGVFKVLEHQRSDNDPARAPLAAQTSMPHIEQGTVVAGTPMPSPNLLTDDPLTLAKFRAEEDTKLTTYAALDRNAGTYRIPIEKAKDLLMQKGLPSRNVPAPPVGPASVK
jgi:hypothetical protein